LVKVAQKGLICTLVGDVGQRLLKPAPVCVLAFVLCADGEAAMVNFDSSFVMLGWSDCNKRLFFGWTVSFGLVGES
jgi:hypothetical protein